MARGKYLSLEEARRSGKINRFCKGLDVGRLKGLGWQAGTDLSEGLRLTYEWFRANVARMARAQLRP